MKKKIITISREFGSGGRKVGMEVAKELGIAYYDSKLVAKIAKETGFDKDFIAESSEFAPEKRGYFFNLSQAGMSGTGTLSLYDQIYICQYNLIKELADKSPCVIVGRCADYILRERTDCLHFFIHADMKDRIHRITHNYGLADQHPKKLLHEMDEKRQTYYRNYTLREWADRENYDAMLNSATLGVEGCVDIITSLFRKMNKEA